jgi:hypothetical protein
MEVLFTRCILNGPDFLVYNVHSLIYLVDEAWHFGSLNECSAFPFKSLNREEFFDSGCTLSGSFGEHSKY